MPLVPVTGSRMKAAIVDAALQLDRLLQVRHAVAASSTGRKGPWYGSRMCTMPPGRARWATGVDHRQADRAGRCAVIRAVPGEDLLPPVTARAMRIAFSLASAPPSVKKTFSMSPGSISAGFSPQAGTPSVVMKGLM